MTKLNTRGLSSIKIGFLCSTNFKLWGEAEGNSINNCDNFKFVISVTKGQRDCLPRASEKKNLVLLLPTGNRDLVPDACGTWQFGKGSISHS